MKTRAYLLSLIVLANACGTSSNFLQDNDSYSVQQDLSLNGSVVLSFQEAYLHRSIAIGGRQASHCRTIAQDYEASSGVALQAVSLKMTHDEEVGRHCARRSPTRKCETYQYVHTFHCQFQPSLKS